ncbi:DUF6291 domain-containing protein [Capnocytophaga gingivalis]
MKDSFVFYRDWLNVMEQLPAEIQLELYQAVAQYALNGKTPTLSPMAKIAFGFIQQSLDRDHSKYEKIVEANKLKGRLGNLKRYYPDIHQRMVDGELSLEEAEQLATAIKTSPNKNKTPSATTRSPNDNVNDNDNDNDLSFLEKKKQKSASVKKSGIEEIDFEELSVETLKEEKEKNSAQKEKEKSSAKAFTPPSPAEVAAYCRERGNDISPESFCSFYASKGWRVGNQPMKDWRAAIRHWETRRSHENKQPSFPKNKQSQPLVIDENGNILSAETNNNTTQANTYVAGRQTAASLSANLQGW